MRHAILGVGGVGGFVGAVLAHGGEHVTAVVRPESLATYPSRLTLESPLGSTTGPIECSTTVAQSFDLLWIAVKATQLDEALASVTAPERIRTIVPLLNGIDHVALLRDRYGHARVVPATILGEYERVAPGNIVHRSPLADLRFAAIGHPRLDDVIGVLQRFGAHCRFVDDERTLLWSKLVVLAPLALTTSASALPYGEVASSATWRPLLEEAHAEACAVAIASGAAVDVAATRRTLLGFPAGLRSSMQKDLEAGRPPELEAIAGPILRGAIQHSLAAPATALLADRCDRRVALGGRIRGQ